MAGIELGELDPLVQKAILDSLTQEARTALIEKAVESLLKPSGYGRPSPIQETFEAAVRLRSMEIAQKVVAEDPRFEEIIKSHVVKFLESFDEDYWDHELMQVAVTAVVSHLKAKARDR